MLLLDVTNRDKREENMTTNVNMNINVDTEPEPKVNILEQLFEPYYTEQSKTDIDNNIDELKIKIDDYEVPPKKKKNKKWTSES